MAESGCETTGSADEDCDMEDRECDQYGFILPSRGDSIGDSVRSYASWFAPKAKRRLKRLQNRRDKLATDAKWTDMKHSALKALLRKGLSPEHRPEVWWDVLGCEARKQVRPGAYLEYLKDSPPPRTLEEIERDLHRTFPNHKKFSSSSADGRSKLRNILRAFACHSPQVRYCQGLNYIAGMFIIVYDDEESAFWAMVCSIERLGVDGYYMEGMTLLRVDIQVLQELMFKKSPKVAKRLHDSDVDLMSISSEWFITWFAKSLPPETTLRVWDTLFFEGYKVLFRIAVGVFKRAEAAVLQCSDFEAIMENARQWPSSMVDHNALLKASFAGISQLSRKDLQAMRDRALLQTEQEDQARLKRTRQRQLAMPERGAKMPSSKPVNLEWSSSCSVASL